MCNLVGYYMNPFFFVTCNNSVTACISLSGKRLILPHHSGAYLFVNVALSQYVIYKEIFTWDFYVKDIELAMNNLQQI